MKILGFLLVLSLGLSGCGGSGSGEESSLKNNDGVITDYEAITVTINSEGVSLKPSEIMMREIENSVSTQGLVLINSTNSTIQVELTELPNMLQILGENPCPSLKKNGRCNITLQLTAPEVESLEDFVDYNDVFKVNGHDVPIKTKVVNDKNIEERFLSEQFTMSETSISTEAHPDRTYSKSILLRNYYDLNLSGVDIQLSNEENQGGVFGLVNNCPTQFKKLTHCLIQLTYEAPADKEGEVASVDIVLGEGVVIPVSLEITVHPSLRNYFSLWQSSTNYNDQSKVGTMVFKYQNLTPSYSGQFSFDIGVLSEDFPAAVSLKNTCLGTMAPLSVCEFSFTFDTEMFHNGVEFEKEVLINNEPQTVSFTGTSPCPAGEKLDENKDNCIPNEGVFDSPDSLFGYAVFQ